MNTIKNLVKDVTRAEIEEVVVEDLTPQISEVTESDYTNREQKREANKIVKRLVKHLRPYQQRVDQAQDAFMSDVENNRATILAGTGSGKTECFIVLIKKLVQLAEKKDLKKILIAHPRLALSSDQQKRLKKSFTDFTVEFTGFSSGMTVDTFEGRKAQSTTDRDTLIELQNTSEADLHITFSSYDSLSKIADLDYDLVVCDEAHYLCVKQYNESLHLFSDDVKVLFYTATPVEVMNQDESMNNVELFGKVIAEVPPSELIPHGYVVPPRVRFMNVTQSRKFGNTTDYATTIAEAYKDQLSLVDVRYNHKMLVAMSDTQQFNEIMSDLANIRKVVGRYDVDVYTVAYSGCSINGRAETDREAVLEHFAKNENKCIIIHCNTLAEGIDVDGIGGVFLLRNLSLAGTIQTIGRAARPAKQDILPDGTINMIDRVKTEAIVTIARVDGKYHSNASTEKFAKAFTLGGYGEMWDYVDAEVQESTGTSEGGFEPVDPIFKEIEDVKFSNQADDFIKNMYNEIGE